MFRIAMVVFSYYPSDTRVRREAEALHEKGITVDVICLKHKRAAKTEKVHGVNVYRISLKRSRGGVLRYFFEYGYFLLAAFFKLSFLHLIKRYSIVHAHNLPDTLVFSALVPKLTGAKIILDMHEIMPEIFMWKYRKGEDHKLIKCLKFLEKISLKFCDHIIVATPFLKETINGRSSKNYHCTAILNLPDPKLFKVRLENNRTSNHNFNLIYPGSLNDLHGVDIAIRAIKLIVSETNIPIKFHIYGHGSSQEWSQLIELTEKLKIERFVNFQKRVPIEQLVKILNNMDAGVVPKRDGVFVGEAISTKLFDFAAVGLPAIVARTKGDSLYFDESMALFFEPEDENQLADCIIQLSRDQELRNQLAKNSELLFKRINWGIMEKDLHSIYEKLIS